MEYKIGRPHYRRQPRIVERKGRKGFFQIASREFRTKRAAFRFARKLRDGRVINQKELKGSALVVVRIPSPPGRRTESWVVMTRERRQATMGQILAAIKKHGTFDAEPGMEIEVVLPEAYPTGDKWRGRKHRALIRRKGTKRQHGILVSRPSAYELLDLIESGWKWDPSPKGLLA